MGTYRSGDCPDDAWMGMIMEYAVMESCYGGQDMDFTNYGKEVQELAEEMHRLRLRKDGSYMESCRKLAERGKEADDPRLPITIWQKATFA